MSTVGSETNSDNRKPIKIYEKCFLFCSKDMIIMKTYTEVRMHLRNISSEKIYESVVLAVDYSFFKGHITSLFFLHHFLVKPSVF